MCVVSMVIDSHADLWRYRRDWYPKDHPTRTPSKEELEQLKDLLKKARKYDKRTQQPDCEMDSKKKILKDLAKELGVEITFL